MVKLKHASEIAVGEGHTESYWGLGEIYLYGYGVDQNYVTARKYFELAAVNGQSDKGVTASQHETWRDLFVWLWC